MKTYAGRRPGIVCKMLNLDRHAAGLLESMASHARAQGQFVSALIVAEVARREERARLRALVSDALSDYAAPTGEEAH